LFHVFCRACQTSGGRIHKATALESSVHSAGQTEFLMCPYFKLPILVVSLALLPTACRPGPDRQVERQSEKKEDKNSPAYKAGQTAHEIATDAVKAAKAAGRKLDEGARKAREGWNDKAKEADKARDKAKEDREQK
jgi:hypothetical protein